MAEARVQTRYWMKLLLFQTASVLTGAIAMAAVSFAQSSPPAQKLAPLGNFQKVDDNVCRGAQPTGNGFHVLAQMGVRCVLDLRAEGGRSTWEAHLVRSLGMQYVNLPLAGYQAPTAKQIADALAILQDTKKGPVFIHCRRGADRTGTIVALYRIAHDHWSNQQALDEAKKMRMAPRERLMENLILQYKP